MTRAATLLVLLLLLRPAQAAPSRIDQSKDWPLEPHACMERAAAYFKVPLALLQAVRAQEAGRVGMVQSNLDGSQDYGVMQINSSWLPILRRKGYTADVLTSQECANVVAGTWILAGQLERAGTWNQKNPDAQAFWRAVGAYHSRDPVRNRSYAEQVWKRFQKIRAAQARADSSAVKAN